MKRQPDSALGRAVARLDVDSKATRWFGDDVLKLDAERLTIASPRQGRLVLVTALTPTPAGEGKTTVAVGLVDALCRSGVRAIGALREPSMGPLFGRKGGAVGGGRARVIPSERINLHFTGDIHAISAAHNLLSAVIDNHVFAGNRLELDPARISWPRTLDMNDRALRKIEVGLATRRGPQRSERFVITAASEVMAILCMATDPGDAKRRLGRIIVGENIRGEPVFAEQLNVHGAMAAILLDALSPNLVTTVEGSPVMLHGGPFANIAQGTSSSIQTRLALRLADVVVTEGGFAFDLGGFKFLDLVGRTQGFAPHVVVCVATVRALRHHGGADFQQGPDVSAVSSGMSNLEAHLSAIRELGFAQPIVAINRYPDDSPEELATLRERLDALNVSSAETSVFSDGGAGGEELARKVNERLEGPAPAPRLVYELGDPVEKKLERIATLVLGAASVELSADARADLARIQRWDLERLPVCIAKTHLSISDDQALRGRPLGHTLHVTGLDVSNGAGFIVARCGPILTMPGLPDRPAAEDVDIRLGDSGWEIVGLH
ncbi:MAG: formate--tetrahydrofolate ligase [Polyangiaceae bacterium]